MKKTISGVLLALASVCALAACGKKTTTAADKTTSAGDKTTAQQDTKGKVVNFYCWNNEFQTRLRKYYPNYDKNISAQKDLLKDGTTLVWTMVANEGGAYQTSLDAALQADMVDMFCFEADYATKYVKSDYVVDMAELGLTEAMKGQYKYTQDIVTNKAGKIVGSSWQGTPGIILYNQKTVADAGLTNAEVETALNTSKDTFAALADKMEKVDTKYSAMIGYADWYRTYSNNLDGKMWNGTKLVADKNLFKWVEDTLEFNTNGYLLGDSTGYGLWGKEWAAGQTVNSGNLTVFSCPWFSDFSLQGNCSVLERDEDGNPVKDSQGNVHKLDIGFGAGVSPYKAVKGYQGWFWGGTWLTATQAGIEDATKKKVITDIIKDMTCNKDVLLALSKGELDFTNNEEAMNALAKDDANGASEYFGGQNVYAIYAESVKLADLSNASDYDQYISEEMQNKFLPYIQKKDAATAADAKACWDAFVKIIKEKTDKTIELPEGVTLTDSAFTIA